MREKQCLVEGCYRDQGERHEGLCDTHAAEAHDAAQRGEMARHTSWQCAGHDFYARECQRCREIADSQPVWEPIGWPYDPDEDGKRAEAEHEERKQADEYAEQRRIEREQQEQRRETARRIRREKAQQAEQQRDPQRLQRLLRDDAPTAIIDMHIKAVLDEHGFEVVEDVIADAAIECIEHEAAIRRAATSNRFRS